MIVHLKITDLILIQQSFVGVCFKNLTLVTEEKVVTEKSGVHRLPWL